MRILVEQTSHNKGDTVLHKSILHPTHRASHLTSTTYSLSALQMITAHPSQPGFQEKFTTYDYACEKLCSF